MKLEYVNTATCGVCFRKKDDEEVQILSRGKEREGGKERDPTQRLQTHQVQRRWKNEQRDWVKLRWNGSKDMWLPLCHHGQE